MYIPRDANITEHEFQLFRISIESENKQRAHTAVISSLISNNERAVSRDRWKKKIRR